RLWGVPISGSESGRAATADVGRRAEAIPYSSAVIQRDPGNWGAYLRRAEAEHALNDRQAATSDYTRAIELHPLEAFLYLRRGRHYRTLHPSGDALNDFEQAIALAPT